MKWHGSAFARRVSGLTACRVRNQRRPKNNERTIKPMKNRSSITTFTTTLSVLACFGLLPQMHAAPDVVPAPDGCYSGFTTAEGCNALKSLTSGVGNTGLGWEALHT